MVTRMKSMENVGLQRHRHRADPLDLLRPRRGHVELVADEHLVEHHLRQEAVERRLERRAHPGVVEPADVRVRARAHAGLGVVDDPPHADLPERARVGRDPLARPGSRASCGRAARGSAAGSCTSSRSSATSRPSIGSGLVRQADLRRERRRASRRPSPRGTAAAARPLGRCARRSRAARARRARSGRRQIACASSITAEASLGVPDTEAPRIAIRSWLSFSVCSRWRGDDAACHVRADAGDEQDVDLLVLERCEPVGDVDRRRRRDGRRRRRGALPGRRCRSRDRRSRRRRQSRASRSRGASCTSPTVAPVNVSLTLP